MTETAIAEHGLIGDLQTAALVSMCPCGACVTWRSFATTVPEVGPR